MNKTIITAALIISGAILLNGHLERRSESPKNEAISKSEIESSVIRSFERAFHAEAGANVIMGKERDINEVKVDDVRFSDDRSKVRVKFVLIHSDGAISSGVILNRDEFGVYRGTWSFGSKKAFFEVKEGS